MLVPLILAICSVLAFSSTVLFFCLWVTLYRAPETTSKSSLGRSAAVVVLGDVGRSPRMCYHVESLANEGWKVAIVGYKGTTLPSPLRRSSIKSHHLPSPPKWIARLPRSAFMIVAPFKVLLQSLGLFWELAALVQPPPEVILVQTPPALPTLFIVRLISILLGSRVIIDWHNLGYTILALRMGSKSPLTRLAEFLEMKTGQDAFAHLFVTNAMMSKLSLKWNLRGRKLVLHDRPPVHFRKSTVEETHTLMTKLARNLKPSLIEDGFFEKFDGVKSTPFTDTISEDEASTGVYNSKRDSEITLGGELRPDSPSQDYYSKTSPNSERSKSDPIRIIRDDRPALVVSSTSWTADEDFGLLLRAAGLYEKRARELNSNPQTEDPEPTRSSSRSSYRNSSYISPPLPSSSPPPPPFTDSPTNSNSTSNPFSHSPSHSSSSSLGAVNASEIGTNQEHPTKRNSMSDRSKIRRPSLGALRTPTLLPNEPAKKLPKMLIIVTGKGELKERYENEIRRLEIEEKWQWVRIRTVWLESEDYPILLGSSDVGISLHTSSSGLDLPMKVVDMLGCELPVCALDFSCLDELIQDGKNGLIFRDAEGLERQLESLLTTLPEKNWLGKNMTEPFDVLDWKSRENPSNSNSPSASPRIGSRTELDSYSSPNSPASSNPPFSLLSSPILSPQKSLTSSKYKNPTSTWSGNWKKVVRPLLQAEDLPSKSLVSKSHSRITSKSHLLSSLVLGDSGNGTLMEEPRSSGEIWNQDELEEDHWNQENSTARESGKKLRHRRSIKKKGTSNSDVPEISVSAPSVGS